MRTYIRIAAGLVASLATSLPAMPADLLACMDRDIADALLRSPSAGSPAISHEWSPQVPHIPLPPEFELIGSSTRLVTGIVALQSSLPPAAARQRLDSALAAAGWRALGHESAMPSPWLSAQPRGFHVQRQIEVKPPDRYCRDDTEPLTVNVTAATRQVGSYLTLVTYRKSGPTCADLAGTGRRESRPSQMPSLALPDGVTMLGSHGRSSAGDVEFETTTSRIVAGLSSSVLLEHLEQQLISQRWRRTSRWATDGFSGSSWQGADTPSSGVLTIVARGDDQYDLRFQLLPLRRQAAGIAIEAEQRAQLERLCRYVTRAAVSVERLTLTPSADPGFLWPHFWENS